MPREGRLGLAHELRQQWRRRLVLAFIEQPLRGVAVPAVRVLERRHELGRRRLPERHGTSPLPHGIGGRDAVDAAAIVAVVQIEVPLDLVRNAPRVLDHLAVHVEDVERAVGGVREIHHANPGVVARGKLHALLIVGPATDQARTIGINFLPVHELPAGVARKRVVHEVLAVRVTAINGRAARTRKITADPSAAFNGAFDHAADAPAGANDPPRFVRTKTKHFRRSTIGRDALPRRRQAEKRVPPRILIVVDPELEVIGVGAGKLATVVVETHSILRAATLEARLIGDRIKPETAPAQFDLGHVRPLEILDLAATPGGGLHVHAIVLPPHEAVEQRLHIESGEARTKASQHFLPHLRLAVAVAILKPPDVGRGADKQSALRPDQSGRPRQVVGKDRALVVNAVTIRVLDD